RRLHRTPVPRERRTRPRKVAGDAELAAGGPAKEPPPRGEDEHVRGPDRRGHHRERPCSSPARERRAEREEAPSDRADERYAEVARLRPSPEARAHRDG